MLFDVSSFCQVDSVFIFHNDTSGNLNLSWEIITPSNNVIHGDSDTVSLSNLTVGNYEVFLKNHDSICLDTVFEIKANSISLDIDSTSFCLFDSILVRTTDTAGALIKSWSVSTPDSVFNFQGDTLPLYLNNPGVYRFEVLYGDSNCTDSIVREFTVDSIPQIVFLPNDSAFCEFDTLKVDTSFFADYSFLWNTGDSGHFTLISDTGFVAVTAISRNGCQYSDSTFIREITPFNLELPGDTFLCAGDTLSLIIPGFFDSVLWSDGDSSFIKNMDTAGLFVVEVSNSCGTLTDSIVLDYVNPPTSMNLIDTVLCSLDSFVIELEVHPQDSILWQDGTNLREKAFYESGTFEVKAENRCGKITETFELTFADTPLVYIDEDLELCEQEEVFRIEIFLENDYSYIWSTGETGSQITLTDSGLYSVTVIDNLGCEGIFEFDVELCPFEVFVPNVFTPNGDGINDMFVVKGLRGKEFNLLIYNRWGILLFDNKGFVQEWDGTVNGKPASAGTYFYTLEYTNEINNRREVKKGSFMLLTD